MRREGHWERPDLEAWLSRLIREQPVLRLKGRLQQQGKAMPLQIQAAGPRLECWFEGQTSVVGTPGLALVLMGFKLDQEAIRSQLTALAC